MLWMISLGVLNGQMSRYIDIMDLVVFMENMK